MTTSDLEALQKRWHDTKKREDLTSFIAHDLSKCGNLDGYVQDLHGLASFISVQDAVQLYLGLRDISSRLEFEWRAQFLSIFPYAATALPVEQVSEADFWSALSRGGIRVLKSKLPNTSKS